MYEVTLAQGYSFYAMLAVAAAAVALTAYFYRRAFADLSLWQRTVLLGLRTAAILLVVILLFRPVLSYQKQSQERPDLIFLLDRSASMSIADDATGVTRFNQARQRLQQWQERLDGDFEFKLIEFSDRAERLEDPSELDALSPDGKATSLARAIEAAAADIGQNDVEAVVLLSDGIHNAAGNPLASISKIGSPVHTIGVGASLAGDSSYRDIQVTGIDCPDRMLKDNIARITAMIEGVGLPGRVIKVVLEEDGQQIAEAELALDNVEGSQAVDFDFRPDVTGRHTYAVRVEPVADERIKENNHRQASALVVEPGIRVLYVEGTLRAEYGALVDRFLAKDPDLEFCALVQTRPNKFLVRSNMSELPPAAIPADKQNIDKFDVFIFGDLDASYLKPEQQQLLVERVRNGAGLIMLGGYHSLGPGGYQGTPLGEILPVDVGNREVGQIDDVFLPALTPEGLNHPIFANIGGFFPTRKREPIIEGLPPLDGCTRVLKAKPSATVLAVFPEADGDMPVLAVGRVDKGRTAVFGGDTTRKWQQGPRVMGQDSPFLRFWGQTVRWLAGRDVAVEAGASITAETDKVYYQPGEPVRISAVVRDEQGAGAGDAKTAANIRGPSGRPYRVALAPVPGPKGNYAGTFTVDQPGEFTIEVETTVADKRLASEKLIVQIGRPNMEFERLDLDEEMLERIAAESGGRYMHISTADYLIDQFDRAREKRHETIQRRLYWPPGLWMLFVGVLTAEWILRRRFQLR